MLSYLHSPRLPTNVWLFVKGNKTFILHASYFVSSVRKWLGEKTITLRYTAENRHMEVCDAVHFCTSTSALRMHKNKNTFLISVPATVYQLYLQEGTEDTVQLQAMMTFSQTLVRR